MELKPPTTFDDQLLKLKARGCFVSDEAFCKRILSRVNYYRLTAYFIPFRREDGFYREGTSFHKVYRIYEFDRKMREILFSAIEEIELYLRTQLAYYHAHKYGADGYMLGTNYNAKHKHELFIDKVSNETSHNCATPFVEHHLKKYAGRFPIWVLVELFSFGMLSHFYADLVMSDQKQLARSLYQTTPYNLRSWLRCCTDLRNICAHYGRLYYQVFPAIPATVVYFRR